MLVRPFFITCFLLMTLRLSAQDPDAIRYLIANCDDSLIIAGVAAHKPDSNRYGDSPILRLKDLKTGKLYLYPVDETGIDYLTFDRLSYFSGTTVTYCLTDAQTDSLLQCSEFVYRLPTRHSGWNYDAEKMRTIGKKYGVVIEWTFFDLDGFYRYNRSAYVRMTERILERRNGAGWKDCFWEELSAVYDSSKTRSF